MKKLCLGCVIACGLVLATICLTQRRSDDSNTSATAVVGLVVPQMEDQWREDFVADILAEANLQNLEIMTVSPEITLDRVEGQEEALRALIVYGVDVILFVPTVNRGWETILREASDMNIPILTIEKTIEKTFDQEVLPYVGYDYLTLSEELTKMMLENARGKEGILELCGTTSAYSTKAISTGVRLMIEEFGSEGGFYSYCGDFLRPYANEITARLLNEDAKISSILCHNDAMALGAVAAVYDAGLVPGEDVLIYTVGCGNDTQVLLEEGVLSGAVVCDTKALAKEAIEATWRIVQGEAVGEIILPAEVVAGGEPS